MRSIHLPVFQVYSNKYIGTPYAEMDCWNVVKTFYAEVLDVEILIAGPDRPLEAKEAGPMIQTLKGHFHEISKKDYQFGDILLLRLFGRPVHLGIYLSKTQILHTHKVTGCMIDRFSRWEKMIEGCYRYEC